MEQNLSVLLIIIKKPMNTKFTIRHPGYFLAQTMKEMKITRAVLSRSTGITIKVIKELINGETDINADIAIRLGACFGYDARNWMNLQSDYNIRIAKENHSKDYKKIKSIAA